LPVERDDALIGRLQSGDDVEERRLARAVRSDESGDGTRFDREVDVRERGDTAELNADGSDLEKAHDFSRGSRSNRQDISSRSCMRSASMRSFTQARRTEYQTWPSTSRMPCWSSSGKPSSASR